MRTGSPFRTLVTLFSRRFFENDLLAPDIDLRPAALWIVGALVAPSLLWSAKRIVPYGLMSVLGPEVMEAASWFDKALLVTLAMFNAGVVTALTWEALLVDRRDAHVLGSLPLAPSLIVAAKGVALLRLLALVAALNVPAAFVIAFAVYGHIDMALVPRAFVVHSAIAMAASLATALVVGALLVAVTSLTRGSASRVVTVAVQAVVLGTLTALLIGLQWTPGWMSAARAGNVDAVGWLAMWPPLWFVSLYQTWLPVDLGHGVFAAHASKAYLAVAGALVAAPATMALWRTALKTMVSASTTEASTGRALSAARLAALLARPARERALVQFFLTTLARSPRHRLAVVSALGLAAAVTFEVALLLSARVGPGRWLTEFAAPVLVLLTLSATARWLSALPAELPASWSLSLASPFDGTTVWRAMHRVLMLLVVAPPALLAAALSAWQGGVRSAIAHVGLVALLGLALVERNLAKLTFLPFASEYVPGRANLTARWPVYVVVLLFVVPALAQVERWLVVASPRAWLVVMALGGAGVALQVMLRRRRRAGLTAECDSGVAWTPVSLNIGQTLMPASRALQ
jgi:hypothetical protein